MNSKNKKPNVKGKREIISKRPYTSKKEPYSKKEPTETDKQILRANNEVKKVHSAMERIIKQLYVSNTVVKLFPDGIARFAETEHVEELQKELETAVMHYESTRLSLLNLLQDSVDKERITTVAFSFTWPDYHFEVRKLTGKVIGCPLMY